MFNCEKCGTLLEDGTVFCTQCGAKVEIKNNSSCPSCGEINSKEAAFCHKCGKPLARGGQAAASATVVQAAVPSNPQTVPQPIVQPYTQPTVQPITQPTVQPFPQQGSTAKAAPAFDLKKIPLKLVAAILVAAVLVSALFIFKPFRKSNINYLTYLKDMEIVYTALNKIEPVQVTDKLDEDDSAESDTENGTAYLAQMMSYYIQYSDDGRYMVYPDHISADGIWTLYYRDLKADNTKADSAIKVDTDLDYYSRYQLTGDGKKIFYIKGEDKNLYCNDLTDKEKIDTGVDSFYVNPDGTMVLYSKEEAIYKKEIGGESEKVKIDSDAFILAVSEDLETIYYKKNDALYLKKGDEEKEKIASDVLRLVQNYDDGSLYYTKLEEEAVQLSTFVNDDLAQSDLAITEPDIYDYQREVSYEEYYGWSGWDDYFITVTDYDAYYDAMDIYYQKQVRDELRTALAAETITLSNEILYFFDGTTETMITEYLYGVTEYSMSTPMVVYTKYDKENPVEMKLSEISSTYDVSAMVENTKTTSSEIYLGIKEKETSLDQTDAVMFRLNGSSDKLYYIDEYSEEDGSGLLMEMAIKGTEIESPVQIDEEVSSYQFKADGDSYVYFKDVRDGTGDMYENTQSIAIDVVVSSVISVPGNSSLVYLADYSENSMTGTLKIFKSTKGEKISDDVSSYLVIDEKTIVYITNFSTTSGEGDAVYYNGSSKPEEIDTDVQGLISKYPYFNCREIDEYYD